MKTKNPLILNIRLIAKLAALELIRYKNITLFLVLNLALGLVGFFLLQIFQKSLTLQSEKKAQVILGGDLSISARRIITEDEIKKWETQFKFIKKTKFISLFSMLRTTRDSRLVNVAVFDDQYPLYGQYKFSEGASFASDRAHLLVDPEIQETLDLKIKDHVEIGDFKFTYAGVITEDPSRLFRGASFAPQVLIHQKYLPATRLIKQGSTLTEYWHYQIDPKFSTANIKKTLEALITDPGVRISTAQDGAENSNLVIGYFTDYLGLVALVALGLCFLCGSYLLQWTFLSKKKSIAIYKTLGLSDKKIIFIHLLQNFVISLLACILAVTVVQSAVPFFQQLLIQKFNLQLELIFSSQALIITCIIAIFGPMFIVVPQIIQIINLRPLLLLQNMAPDDFRRSFSYVVWLIIAVSLFLFLAVWQSNSIKVAIIFTSSLVGLIFLFQVSTRFLLFILEKLSYQFNWRVRYAARGLTRKQASASLVLTTMSLSTLVLSLLPHLKSSIINEIKPEQSMQLPGLFIFDIQPEQVAGVRKIAKKILNTELIFSPLVRSRILKINDEYYERILQTNEIQTREAGEEARSRNRGLNLTYRSWLQESERNVEGQFVGTFITQADEKKLLPQISIEKRFAKRMNIKIKDILTFDVQGVELKAEVGALRQVRWTSFQPNFFILFPTGVLEEAPQIFLTSVPNNQKTLIKEFQQMVTSRFKNISIIDVRRTVENSFKYIDQMSLGLQFMAWLAVLVGVFVFLVLINTQTKERLPEMNLLQILGASNQQIRTIILYQFIFLITTSIVFGVLLGLGLAWVIITFFYDIKTVYDVSYLALLCAVLIPICGTALYIGLRPLQKLNYSQG